MFESIEVKDLEARYVQDANEGDPLHLGVDESFVASVHQVAEQLLKQSTGDRRHLKVSFVKHVISSLLKVQMMEVDIVILPEFVACDTFWPLVTHSAPTLILGLTKFS